MRPYMYSLFRHIFEQQLLSLKIALSSNSHNLINCLNIIVVKLNNITFNYFTAKCKTHW